jgi:hypothetical protein
MDANKQAARRGAACIVSRLRSGVVQNYPRDLAAPQPLAKMGVQAAIIRRTPEKESF